MANPNWSELLEHAVVTDVGMRRASNQDSYSVALASDNGMWRERGHVFLVADGMGAHAAGELASKMSADGVPHTYHKLRDLSAPDAIRKSIEDANAQIHQRGQANAEFQGMGTTTSVLVVLPHGALVAHVGDSRVYRLRGTRLEQLSFDHSLVWEMMAAGQTTRDNVPSFVPKNIITRSLGPHPQVQVDLEGPFPTQVGDTFMLCSDGLTGQVQDEEIGMLLGCLAPADAAQVLVDLANLRGGPDNITVVVARVKGQGMTTAAAGAIEPLTIGGQVKANASGQKSGFPWLFGLAGAALAAGGVMAAMDMLVPGAATAAVGVLLGIVAAINRFAPASSGDALAPGARLGKGPHTACDCAPTMAFVETLEALVEELREAATEGQWQLDWNRFTIYRRQAGAAQQRGEIPKAVSEYSRALRFMMSELRSQRTRVKKPSDSEVDL